MSADGARSTHFGRLNSLVDNGWLAVLSGAELAMWITYTKFADKHGIAFPDGDKIAAIIGNQSDKHIGRIRKNLISFGLMEQLESGGGRGHPMKIRLLNPPVPKPRSEVVKSPLSTGALASAMEQLESPKIEGGASNKAPSIWGGLNAGESLPDLGGIATINPPKSGNNPPQIGDLHYKEDPTIDPTNTSPASPSGAVKAKTIQQQIMDEVWRPKWAAAHHGEDYCPGKLDFVKLAEILTQLGVKRDESHARKRFAMIADAALVQPETFGWQGHKLSVVQKHLQFLISTVAKKINGHKPRAAGNDAAGWVDG